MTYAETLAVLVVALYNLAVLGVAIYLVQVHGWSPWWLLGAFLCLKYARTGKSAESDEE